MGVLKEPEGEERLTGDTKNETKHLDRYIYDLSRYLTSNITILQVVLA